MTDKEINKECRHINLTDWGTYSCKLYNPRIPAEKAFVQYGICEANTDCPWKQLQRKEQECEELKEIFKEYTKSHHYNNAEFKQERDSLIQEIQYNNCYKQALEKIKDIVTQITFTVAGGEESPKWEWIRLYRNIVYEVSRILNEVKDA